MKKCIKVAHVDHLFFLFLKNGKKSELTDVLSALSECVIMPKTSSAGTREAERRAAFDLMFCREDNMNRSEKICRWKQEKDVVLLAHYYVDKAVQEVADFVGDSYALAKTAVSVSQKNILFAGVSFMGESAKLLNPDKHVYMVDGTAGCPMADMVDAEQVRRMREKYPQAAVVCYVNSSAKVKAESDVCVTSSNAVRVVGKLHQKQIYFIPDSHLGHFVAKELPDKEFLFHDGYCPTHQSIDRNSLLRAKEEHPDALTLAHPECSKEILELSDFVGSTADIIRFAGEKGIGEYIIATETGVFHPLQKENPDSRFYPVIHCQVCPDMQKSTLEKIEHMLKDLEKQPELLLDGSIMERARLPLEQMLLLAQ